MSALRKQVSNIGANNVINLKCTHVHNAYSHLMPAIEQIQFKNSQNKSNSALQKHHKTSNNGLVNNHHQQCLFIIKLITSKVNQYVVHHTELRVGSKLTNHWVKGKLKMTWSAVMGYGNSNGIIA